MKAACRRSNRHSQMGTEPLSAPQKLVVLLTALKVFLPKRGVRRVRYPQTDLGGGIVGLNEVGEEGPAREQTSTNGATI